MGTSTVTSTAMPGPRCFDPHLPLLWFFRLSLEVGSLRCEAEPPKCLADIHGSLRGNGQMARESESPHPSIVGLCCSRHLHLTCWFEASPMRSGSSCSLFGEILPKHVGSQAVLGSPTCSTLPHVPPSSAWPNATMWNMISGDSAGLHLMWS